MYRRRVLVVAALAVAALFVTPLPSQAATDAGAREAVLALDNCKEEPPVTIPGTGTAGIFEGDGPKGATSRTPKFTEEGAPLVKQYGLAAVKFRTYDLGCIGKRTNFAANIDNTVGNWIIQVPIFGVEITSLLTSAAFDPTYLRTFDKFIRNVVNTINENIFDPWILLTMTILGGLLLWRAKLGNVAAATKTVGWALLVLVVATFLFNYPIKAATSADGVAASVIGSVHTSMVGEEKMKPDEAVTQNLFEGVLWHQWKAATFGDPDSKTANKYAGEVWDSVAISWGEYNDIESGKKKAADVVKTKQENFERLANEIREKDPATYEFLTGRDANSKVSNAFTAAFAFLCIAPLLIASSVLLIASYLIIRLAVMLFPAIAVIAVIDKFDSLVKGIFQAVMAAVVNSIIFGIGAAVNVLAIYTLLSPDVGLPRALCLLLALIVTVLMWMLLKPARKLTTMMPVSAGNAFQQTAAKFQQWGDQARGLTKTAVGAFVGGAAGGAVAGKIAEKQGEEESLDDRAPAPYRETYPGRQPAPDHEPAALPTAPAPEEAPALPTGDRAGLGAAAAGTKSGAAAVGGTTIAAGALPSGSTTTSDDPNASAVSDDADLFTPDPVEDSSDGTSYYIPPTDRTTIAGETTDDSTSAGDDEIEPRQAAWPEVDDSGAPVYDIYTPSSERKEGEA